jgi:predicted ribosome quality control (RQC) complex YloA/Tae2 family protein
MKKELSSIDLIYTAKELQALVNAKIDQIYQVSKKDIILQLHVTGKGKMLLRIMPGFAYIAKKKPEMPENLIGFCNILRKYLGNSRISKISQPGSERILEICFDAKEGKFRIIAEFFGGSNIIFCKEDGTIVQASENKRMREREIRGGVKYKTPLKGIDLTKVTKSQVKEIIKKSKKDNVSTALAIEFGLGGVYARELCNLAGVEEGKKDISDAEAEKIHLALQKITGKRLNPHIVYSEKEVFDATPFEFKTYSNLDSKKTDSFSSAVELVIPKKEKKLSKYEKEIKKLEKAMSQQEKRVVELGKIAKEMQKKGEFVYENYQTVKEILDEIKKARIKYSWKEIKEKLEGHKTVKEVDGKTGTIVIEL